MPPRLQRLCCCGGPSEEYDVKNEYQTPGHADLDKLPPVEGLLAYLRGGGQHLCEQGFARAALTRLEAAQARRVLWDAHQTREKHKRAAEFHSNVLKLDGNQRMPIWYKTFGHAPFGSRAALISMHGGGGCPAQVNDSQWENQKRLYVLTEGVYIAPRAPTNTWNCFHEPHVDAFFARLIQDMILFEGVDPRKVYLTGYSAGGDGCYQLAARMPDRFAAAGAMAGHPNDTRIESLRNLPFTVYCGKHDDAYNRAGVAREWQAKLAQLRKADPGLGYEHSVVLHDSGHWMCGAEKAGIVWMTQHTRNVRPDRIVWVQSSVTHSRFYWLATDAPCAGAQVTVQRVGQRIEISDVKDVRVLHVRLDDEMVNLDEAVEVVHNGRVLFCGVVPRTIETMHRTLEERGDPDAVFCASLTVLL